MTLAELSIRRPVFAWMLMLGLIVFGGLAFTRLGVSQLPDVDFPVITINLKMEGAPPEVMELDVVDVIEDKVMSIEGVKSVSSSAKSSSATVKVEFDLSRNIDLALQDVQAKIAQAQKQLPSEMDPPSITKTNPDDLPILFFSVQAEGYTRQELMTYVRDTLKNKFATLPGVGEVRMGGYLEPNMRVWIRDKDLKRFQLAVNDVIDNVGREHVDPPTGQVNEGVFEYNMRFYGEATEPDQFGQLRLNTRGGGPNYNPIRLADVATLQEGTEDVRTVARAMGQSSLNVGIVKQRGSNAVAVARAVRAKLAEIQPDLPKGMSVGINFDSSKYVEEAVGELNFTLLLSALMTGLVCWMFLGSFSSTFNVLLAIPTSIIGAFSVLHFFGFTLNTFTLLALSMAIGIVVDDAIMVLENITRHREMGKSRGRAALDGAKEITFAAAAASVSVVAIFLPVAFMSGIIGKFFFQFGVTMTAAVLISLLEALTLSPMRAASLGAEHVAEQRATKLGRFFEAAMTAAATFYGRTLELALRRKWAVIGAATAVCVGSFFILKLIRQEFIPA
ncbi:MAG: efflux RND transporter permease subunit, partial [Bacteriovoracia bacterium]